MGGNSSLYPFKSELRHLPEKCHRFVIGADYLQRREGLKLRERDIAFHTKNS